MRSDGFGQLVRAWRRTRGLSQQRLAEVAEVSTRHLSCLETGKAQPSRTMVLVLANGLDLPLRDRNALLHAAGFASIYRESRTSLEDPASPLAQTVQVVLRHHGVIPAVAAHPNWDIATMNPAALRVFAEFLPSDIDAVISRNVMHALFHPDGLRPWIVNWHEVAQATLERLHHEARAEIDGTRCADLLRDLADYPNVIEIARAGVPPSAPAVYLAIHLKKQDLELRFFTTVSTLGTPLDVAAEELRFEVYYPADAQTESWLKGA